MYFLPLVSILQVTLTMVAVVAVATRAVPLPAAVTEVSGNTVHSLTAQPATSLGRPARCLVLAACRVEAAVERGVGLLVVVWEVVGLHTQAGLVTVHVHNVHVHLVYCT